MPKKSNKTAHVLSLLTNGNGDPLEDDFSEQKKSLNTNSDPQDSIESSKPDVIVEMKDSLQTDSLSRMVKSDLEKELDNELKKRNSTNLIEKNSIETTEDEEIKNINDDTNERPPYSKTFIEKFGIGHASSENLIHKDEEKDLEEKNTEKEENKKKDVEEEINDSDSTNQVKSELYVLENFNDEEDEVVSMENVNILKQDNTVNPDTSDYSEGEKILHNFAEDIIKSKAPIIMQNLNMCICSDCINDVTALTLNHTKPLYTVTEKGQLYQKLTAYETQYGADLASQITKACVKVKLNPRHRRPSNK